MLAKFAVLYTMYLQSEMNTPGSAPLIGTFGSQYQKQKPPAKHAICRVNCPRCKGEMMLNCKTQSLKKLREGFKGANNWIFILEEASRRHTTFVKADPEEFAYEACNTAVKTENNNYNSPPSPYAVDFSTSAPEVTQSYLELAVDLPWFAVRGRKPSGKRIVVLRDSAMSKWPVLYHERSSLRVLASGWKALAEANNLQKGDIFLMSVKKASEGLLQLEIKIK